MACLVKVRMKQFGRGWTYTFYSPHDSATAAVNAYAAVKNQIIRVHDKGTYVKYISASKIGTRDKDRLDINQNPVKIGDDFAADADVVSTAARVRLRTASGTFRFLWLRGLADSAVRESDDGQENPEAIWLGRVNTLIGVLGGQNPIASVRSVKAAVGNYRFIDVLNIAAEANSSKRNSVFTLREAPPFAAGQRVIFTPPGKDVVLLPYQSSHRVRAVDVDAKTFTINASYKGPDAGYQPFDMKARWEDFDFLPVSGGQFITFGQKQTGPDESPRGRERSKSYRHS